MDSVASVKQRWLTALACMLVLLSLPEPEWLTIRNSPVMALSPDGSHVVYSAGGSGLLYIRPLGAGPSRLLGSNLEGSAPFFSPDGKWVGFFSDGGLRKVSVDGGE